MSSPEEAKEVVRRWNDEGWSGGKYDLAHEIISPEMTVHGAGGQQIGMGPDALIDLIRTWRTAFPDGSMTIDDLIVEGDLVGIRNTWRGTQQAEFYGIPPSGNTVTVTSVGLDRVRDGKVVEGWGELDMVGMMQALGAMPTAGPGAVASGKDPAWGPTRSEPGAAPASLADNKAVLVRFIRALDSGDRAGVEEVVDRDAFVEHNPVWGTESLDSVLESTEALRRALPDLRVEVDEANMIAEGDQVAAHSLLTGTHTGDDLLGVAASGKPITWSHSEFVRIRDGRIVERWVSADTLTLFQQAGVLPGGG
jgi:predicted ester cyclase